MRKLALAILGVLLLGIPASVQAQSVAEAAKKAREQKKQQPTKAATKVFTNDNLPPVGASAEPGVKTAAGGETLPGDETQAAATGAAAGAAKDEAAWRKRFADARTKLANAEKELDILQRELNGLMVQYYPDPNKALREQYERKEINEHRQKIENKRKEVDALKQAISDLEDELRAAGGPPGWAREP